MPCRVSLHCIRPAIVCYSQLFCFGKSGVARSSHHSRPSTQTTETNRTRRCTSMDVHGSLSGKRSARLPYQSGFNKRMQASAGAEISLKSGHYLESSFLVVMSCFLILPPMQKSLQAHAPVLGGTACSQRRPAYPRLSSSRPEASSRCSHFSLRSVPRTPKLKPMNPESPKPQIQGLGTCK